MWTWTVLSYKLNLDKLVLYNEIFPQQFSFFRQRVYWCTIKLICANIVYMTNFQRNFKRCLCVNGKHKHISGGSNINMNCTRRPIFSSDTIHPKMVSCCENIYQIIFYAIFQTPFLFSVDYLLVSCYIVYID